MTDTISAVHFDTGDPLVLRHVPVARVAISIHAQGVPPDQRPPAYGLSMPNAPEGARFWVVFDLFSFLPDPATIRPLVI